jgi:hypothetical protein
MKEELVVTDEDRKWAKDILTLIFERAEIYSTEDGSSRVLEMCSCTAWANEEKLIEDLAKELAEGVGALCDTCRNEVRDLI